MKELDRLNRRAIRQFQHCVGQKAIGLIDQKCSPETINRINKADYGSAFHLDLVQRELLQDLKTS